MKIGIDEIKAVALGAEIIRQEDDGVHFYRFTEEQKKLYVARNAEFSQYLSTSGICLRFLTDSRKLFLKVFTSIGSCRNYFAFDICVNGEFFDSLNNFYSKETDVFPDNVEPLGEFEKEFLLPDGEKEICIYFPWSVCGVLKELSLDDGSFIKPIKPEFKMLCFGDSITQGYDAFHPSNKYTTRLARYLGAEEFNKAMGGDGFFPELIPCKENFEPDYIIGAYGTNDWTCHTTENFDTYCKNFYKNLSITYPNSKIYAISPIWRKDYATSRKFGDFTSVSEHIKKAVAEFKNVTFISGFNLFEHNEKLYRELTLHPNDAGFKRYFESLKEFIK